MSIKAVFDEIEQCLPEGGDWCDIHKAHTLAALVLSTRPRVVVEIGVWLGGSALPMLIAMRENGVGRTTVIDPWSQQASVIGETPTNAAWWGKVDHERAFKRFKERLIKHRVESICEIQRARSDDAIVPESIELIHVDGNHTDQAVRDVDRFLPHVKLGGFAVMDDVAWIGDGVVRAVAHAELLGFESLYSLGSGLVMQRRRMGP